MNSNNQRLKEFDALKGLGILCVILGHLGNPYIDRVVYVFHMPLFFLISGYFLSYKGEIKRFIFKKIESLVFPYFVSCFLIIISYLIILHLFGYPGRRGVVGWIVVSIYGAGFKIDNPSIGYIGAIWFLLALFWAMIIVRIVENRKYSFYIIVIISYLGWKTASDFYLPFSLQSGMFASLFVYLGFVFKKFESNISSPLGLSGGSYLNQSNKFLLYGILLFVTIWDMVFYKGFYMANCFMGNGLIDIVAALSACYLLYICLKKTDHHFICGILSFYGRNSLIVLCFHIVEQNTFPYSWLSEMLSQKSVSGFVILFIVLLIKVLWATIWIVIINRIPVLKSLFHGSGLKLNSICVSRT